MILLDEPTAGMSHSETEDAIELIRRVTQGKTLLMVEHDMGVVFDLADTHHGAGLRRGDRLRPADRDARQPRGAGSLSRRADGGVMLEVRDLHAYYGKSHILHGVDMTVGEGEIVSLLGRNGVGRSTTCKAIMGLVDRQGTVRYRGRDDRRPARQSGRQRGHRLRAGEPPDLPHAHRAPEPDARREARRQVRPLEFRRHVQAVPEPRRSAQHTAAGVLSGGEQQMLTLCRTLMGDPDLIMIDEPTEGLAPKIVEQVGRLLEEIARRGVSILLVEQKLTIAMQISQRLYVMGHGRIVFEGTPADMRRNADIRKEWLEV